MAFEFENDESEQKSRPLYTWEEDYKTTWASDDLYDPSKFLATKRVEFEQKLKKRQELEVTFLFFFFLWCVKLLFNREKIDNVCKF
jgi:hypothetical protein